LGDISSSGRTHGRAALLGYNSKVSSSNVQATAWLDVRVVYVRVSGCPLDDDAPESLTVRFPARSIGTALEVNGGRISPSEEALLVLRRDRIGTESAEATYVSTDNLRASGASVSYEVFNRDEALVSGTIEQQSEPRPPPADAANSTHQEWKMECNCVVGQSGCVFLKCRNDYPSMSLAPAPVVEVCVVGRFSGTPVILTRTVQMSARRRLNRKITLDAIPESEAVGRTSTGSLIAMDHQPQLVSRILPKTRSPPIFPYVISSTKTSSNSAKRIAQNSIHLEAIRFLYSGRMLDTVNSPPRQLNLVDCSGDL
jgi:hypothetical protein